MGTVRTDEVNNQWHMRMASEHSPERLVRSPAMERTPHGRSFLSAMESLALPNDLCESFISQIAEVLPLGADAVRVLRNVQHFLEASRSPQAWLGLFEREADSLETLVQLFSISQFMADVLIADPEAFDLLRITGGQPTDKSVLEDEIMAAVRAATDSRSVKRVLRSYRHRETLRIAYGEFIQQQGIETVTEQISQLAECLIAAAVWAAERELSRRWPAPTHQDGRLVGFAVIALGKLGGSELNYSSDIDLVFVSENLLVDLASARAATSVHNTNDYFQRMGRAIIKLLGESTPDGFVYRVDMRFRPHGERGPLVVTLSDALDYYDSLGRTWERQVFTKARPVAGDIGLGRTLVEQLQPWIYRRYLMRADITGLAALKRRLEKRAEAVAVDIRDVSAGNGGIRDVEYVIQFLQLLYGGDEPSVRCTGTIEAIQRLANLGCLTPEEKLVLQDNYQFLRRIEHYLQIMLDRKTHCLPLDPDGYGSVAVRMGYCESGDCTPARAMQLELLERSTVNRRILDQLLHEAFLDDASDVHSFGSPKQVSLESDLILDPQPTPAVIQSVLQSHGFVDCPAAYRNLQQLSVESIRFLSTRRCRHFLSAIAPELLKAIAGTPNPDATLISLANVSDSLGGKAVLWELFSASPAAMHVCVRLCACSPYLASILTSNPGMVDELLDSLMLDKLPERDALAAELDALCRNATDIAPMLHSFKNSMHLRIGVRDILGRDAITVTHAALSDIAEVCMEQVIQLEFHRMVHQLGVPKNDQGGVAELVVLAVGKLGGREPNYHSDLDVIFLFDQEGMTESLVPNRRFAPTTNRHFFNQLCQRIIHAVMRIGNTGRLFDIDVRLRPLGRSGELAITFEDLQNYFVSGGGQVWERQALCKARPIWGSAAAQQAAMDCVRRVLLTADFASDTTRQIYAHRMSLQAGAGESNLKRGVGGTMDVEFIVQFLQLAHVGRNHKLLVPGTLDAIRRLQEDGCLESSVADRLYANYEFLRSIESGIRLMNMSARHDLPRDTDGLARLAFLLSGRQQPAQTSGLGGLTYADLPSRCNAVQTDNRQIFNAIFTAWLDSQPTEDEG